MERTLEQIQLELEEESVGLGIERYREEVKDDQSSTRPGKRLLIQMLEPLIVAIKEQQDDYAEGKPIKGSSVWYFLNQFSPEQLAFVTAKAVVNGAGKGNTSVQSLSNQIMSILEATLNHEELKKENPRAYHKLQEKIKKATHEGYRQVVLKRQMKFAGIRAIKWGISEKHKAGLLLLKLLESSTGAFVLKATATGGRNETPLLMATTSQTEEWLRKSHEYTELLTPAYVPMVVQPKEWSTPFNGGYLSNSLPLQIIKKGATRGYLEQLEQWDMPVVYRSINALQNTKWAVNQAVLRVLDEVWQAGGNLGKIPSRDPLPVPTTSFEGLSEVEIKDFKRQCAKVHEENARMESKRFALFHLIDTAKKYSEFNHFHYVYTMDWRGRIYPVSAFLNPQGNDVAKGLLQFAEGKPLGADGVAWLAVHGANSYGVDKVSFEERIQWVQDNHEAIIESALNPLDGSRFWTEADSPYQFLAFCFEWLGYTMQGESFVSHLAVGLDGSCNGLQHLSAVLRDSVGGAATNLVPADKPADIYSAIAKVAQAQVDRDAKAGVKYANLWVGKVVRKVAKRPAMTLSYGATKFGFGNQLRETLKKINEEDKKPYLGEGVDEFRACVYLAGVLYDAIGEVVIAARQAMDWLQEVAKVVASNGLPIRWETPAGLLVNQNYRKLVGKRLDMTVAGQRVQLMLRLDSTETDVRRNAAGISPNVVHSWDSSHLMLTINACLDAGITEFAMVHDSYGTHACNAGRLGGLLRECFIQQYSSNVMENFRNQVLEQLPEEMHKLVPPVPALGDLDLEAIRYSDYFFA